MFNIQSFDLRKNALRWLLGASFEPIAIEVGSTLSRGGYLPTTTTLYLEAALKMKKQALHALDSPNQPQGRFEADDQSMRFLEQL